MNTCSNKVRIILVSFAIALMGCVCARPNIKTSSQDEGRKNFIRDLESRTVALVTDDGSGKLKPYCSGVWIDGEKFLTAAHCVNNKLLSFYMTKEDLEAGNTLSDGTLKLASLIKISERDDLALFLVPNKISKEPIQISKDDPWVGMRLHIIGHTSGMWWSYIEGLISASTKSTINENRVGSIQVSAPVWMGNSGGGAFDEQGRLVGLCSWMIVSAPNISFFIPASVIENFLKN